MNPDKYLIGTYYKSMPMRAEYCVHSESIRYAINRKDAVKEVQDENMIINTHLFDKETLKQKLIPHSSNRYHVYDSIVFYSDDYAVIRFTNFNAISIYEIVFMRAKDCKIEAEEIEMWEKYAKEIYEEDPHLNTHLLNINRHKFIDSIYKFRERIFEGRYFTIDKKDLGINISYQEAPKALTNRIFQLKLNHNFRIDKSRKFFCSDMIKLTNCTNKEEAFKNIQNYMECNGFIDDN